ncbi:GNAT family N-acetyltransferase [Spongiactinospora gelatinilytica]|uniref:GNAT family N-acetyltransferase n=1 Tax=Spongiactinospora gelatinilytica TaxID=2666298 RepID=A0A2W2GWU7_9ACTN|nr:GNAT family N-acetyltransferase [Spongiactinospora gelatinilytica]PZG54156.1 GNAT family N-acetyltransferase [Spongiactinospora gelatinilytica]
MTDLVIRPLRAGEEDRFFELADPALVGVAWTGRDYRELLSRHEYRPEWTWVALRDERVVARAAWWGGPDDADPINLDWYDFDGDREAAVALLRGAPFTAEYCLVLPPGWRDHQAVAAEAEARLGAAREAGMRPLVERIRFRWAPADGLPVRPTRLEYRPCDDDAVLDAIRRIHMGTLDAHVRDHTAREGAEAAAREELEILKWFPGPREWWRLAYTPAGELAGLTVPSRNYAVPVIGLIGVVPELRGHGYGYDLLAEATHMLAEEGAEEVVGETDFGNTPMAAAFRKAGYPVVQERVFMKW